MAIQRRGGGSGWWRALVTVTSGIVVVLVASGCTAHVTRTPNAADANRLRQLEVDPLLAGGKAERAAGVPDTSANWNVRRASVELDGQQNPAGATTFSAAATALARARAEGWSVISVACEARSSGLDSATIVAVKKLDGFTAAIEVRVRPSSWSASAYAPFHLEKANPWTPKTVLAVGSSCVESPTEPTRDSKPSSPPNVIEHVLI